MKNLWTRPKVIVFDVDGTLVNSFLDFPALKKKMGFSQDSFVLEELEKIQNGERKRELLYFLHEFEMEGAEKSVLFEGVLEFLNYCDEQGFKRAAFTRNSHKVIELIFNKFRLSFEKVVSRDSLCEYKPHPKGLEVIGHYFKANVEEMLFIGDHYHDVLTGKRAGVRTFLFNNGNHDIKNWESKADFVFDNFCSLKGIFEKRFFGQ